MITVDSDNALKAINNIANQLKPKQVAGAMSRSINRTLTHERKVSRQLVRSKYNFPSDVVNNFSLHTANPSSLTGKMAASSKAISLAKFNPSYITGSYSAKIKRSKNGKEINTTKAVKLRSGRAPKITGVTLTIIKGKKQTLNYAFISKGGAKPVFARGVYGGKGFSFGKSRLPISALKTTSLYQAIAGQATRDDLNKDALQFYAKTFEREIRYQIAKASNSYAGVTR